MFMKKSISLWAMILMVTCTVSAQRKKQKTEPTQTKPTIASFTAKMTKYEGFFDFYSDDKQGKIYLLIDKVGQEFLYVNALAAGVGSNDIGLDRGQLGNERVVRFERHGNKVLLIQPNQGYRAVSENADEVKSVAEAFASSAIGGFTVKMEEGNNLLVDITNFLLRDSHGVSQRLKRARQGNYSLDKTRSAVYLPATFNFPKNTEFESLLTFKGAAQGAWIRSVTPSPDAVTVRTHHSFIELPDSSYEPREFDPRAGFISISYQDYATPIEESLVKRLIVRHRLQKKNPGAARSEAVEPIIYYVDRGAPEPIRSALIDGAKWWNQAFEAAGFINAFQVEVMPEDAHPLDVRYNVIQWVHRSTRGWSYGSSVVDPRTGEILKGHVSLGSLRVRQDFLIAEGLLSPYESGGTVPEDMKEMALARLRQLSAHEVGHTIGLVHNFAASTNNRASVMDYPHPYVKIDAAGKIDLSEAYDVNIGAWDKVAIQYGYGEYNGINEARAVLDKAFADGYRHISDRDARPVNGAHPAAHLWDNGTSAADELTRMMAIRAKIIDNFSEKAIREGRPMSDIENVLVPMYLFHRYQVDATSKVVGGINYTYKLRGDGQVATELIPASTQMAALDALIATLRPAALRLPESLLAMLPPVAQGYSKGRENFASKAGPAFDYFAAAETASSLPIMFLLDAHRANRMEMLRARNADQPGFSTVLNKLTSATWKSPATDATDRALQKIVEMEYLEGLMKLYNHKEAYDQVKALARNEIVTIQRRAKAQSTDYYYSYVTARIESFFEKPDEFEGEPLIKAPDGSPIGSYQPEHLCSHGY